MSLTDRADDRRAGKTNRLANKPPWPLALLLAVPALNRGGLQCRVARRSAPRDRLSVHLGRPSRSIPPALSPQRPGHSRRGRGRVRRACLSRTGRRLAGAAGRSARRSIRSGSPPSRPGRSVAVCAASCGIRSTTSSTTERPGCAHWYCWRSRRVGRRLAAWVALPLEAIGLSVLLWRMQSLLPLTFLLLYAAYAALRWKLWAIPVVVVAPRERYSVLGQESAVSSFRSRS